ncbi:MAG: type VI secretion system baseplate subunit TssK [Gammaproteobacteria bacterium]|nr:type VI secretion system baseplate subunit TssK [Gammaproteobacteria bacterium]
MSYKNKVVWSQGLFVQPQHFQQHSRYFEDLINARSKDSAPYDWGISELKIDEELLSQGKIAISHCSGRFPDGTPFVINEDSIRPKLIDVPECQDVEVFLALPVRRYGSVEIDFENRDEGLAREITQNVNISDTTSGASAVTEMQTAQLNMRLMLEHEKRTDFTVVGIARITERRPDGQILLDGKYLPSCLNINAVPRLRRYLDDICSLVNHRGDALANRVSDGRTSTSEIADFLFLQAVNRYQALLQHLQTLPVLHPEHLYSVFRQMSAEFSTFTRNQRRPMPLDGYEHSQMDQCFEHLMGDLRHSLSVIIEQNVVQLAVQSHSRGVFSAPIQDHSLLKNATFILAAKASVGDDAIRKQFPAQIKIGPVERIRELVNLSISGIAIKPMPAAPKQVPYHTGYTYFEMDQSSQLWPLLSSSGGFAFHVSGDFPNLELELWAIKGK